MASGSSGTHTFQSMRHAQARLFKDAGNGSRSFTRLGEEDLEGGEGDGVPLNAIRVKRTML
jgi:hypothetical protein